MKRARLALIALAILFFATGCVSKTQYQSLQTDLTACEEQKAQAEAQVITWEQRFDREAQRWESMGATITDQVPRALSELNAERDRIVELVPEQVRSEVETYLDNGWRLTDEPGCGGARLLPAGTHVALANPKERPASHPRAGKGKGAS